MSLVSRFSWRVFFAPFCLACALFLLLMIAALLLKGKGMTTAVFAFLVVLLNATLLMFLEVQKRAIRISIDEYSVTVCRFLGMGAAKIYLWEELSFFTVVNLPSRYGTYEYLFINKEGKTVIAVSEFYHKNYKELHWAIADKVANGGTQDMRFFKEIRRLFE